MDAKFWEDRYRSRDQLFSGSPNGVLVTEIDGLPPGQALDVGCGEGADARWLASHGWHVTAVDISRTALHRAAAAARSADPATEEAAAAERIAWVCADLAVSPLPVEAFDLISVQYFPLRRQSGDGPVKQVLDAVAPGGTLLFVSHDPGDLSAEHHVGDYYQPADIAPLLGDGWTVLVNESRPRVAPAPPGTAHTRDTVLRARKVGHNRK
ncbi:class I SAM-dependent methyltransferase [Amycolatopsis jejuensis]|uniref:class I SAM-dependent methyltransferase n=1 Tax=Amycolatopsis jejuensis TaxID=330084 RepID=UPI0005245416|nr:methyltransferase domain-containing protein [Amycolatopsis jejuensis]